jgi:CcmD family protein
VNYLFAAYCAIWLILFAYMFSIRSRQSSLEKTVEALTRRLEGK